MDVKDDDFSEKLLLLGGNITKSHGSGILNARAMLELAREALEEDTAGKLTHRMNESCYLFYRLLLRGLNDSGEEKTRVIETIKEYGLIPMLARVLSLTETDSPKRMIDGKVAPGDVDSYNYCHVQKYCTTGLGMLAMDPATTADIDAAIQSLYSAEHGDSARTEEQSHSTTKSVVALLVWQADAHNIGEKKPRAEESQRPRPDRALRAVCAQILLRRLCSGSHQWQSLSTDTALKKTLEMDEEALANLYETTLAMQLQLPEAAKKPRREASASGLRESVHVSR